MSSLKYFLYYRKQERLKYKLNWTSRTTSYNTYLPKLLHLRVTVELVNPCKQTKLE